MLKAYRYRIYPTEEQAAFLNRQFGSVRYVYNWALETATTTYQTQGKGVTRFQLDKRLTALKQELPWLGSGGPACQSASSPYTGDHAMPWRNPRRS